MNYKVIALDLDGTLLTDNKIILPQTIHSLSLAQQQGCQVLIVTGRHHTAIKPFYNILDLATPALCCNGTYLYDFHHNKPLLAKPLNKTQSDQLIDLIDFYKMDALLYIDEAMLYERESDERIIGFRRWAETLPADLQPTLRQVNSLTEAVNEATYIWKFALLQPEIHKLHQFISLVEAQLGLTCERSCSYQIDITQTGNNKGALLNEWLTQHGYDFSQVIAFGDNFNDMSMITRAGLGVAMENSVPELKEHADLIIENNNQPGIAKVIDDYILK